MKFVLVLLIMSPTIAVIILSIYHSWRDFRYIAQLEDAE